MEPFKPKNTILDTETVKDTLTSAIKKPLTVQKKPVKFTWEGLKNFSLIFSTNPFDKLKRDRLETLMSGEEKPKEKDYIDFLDLERSGSSIGLCYGYNILLQKNKSLPIGGHMLSITYSKNFLFRGKNIDIQKRRRK